MRLFVAINLNFDTRSRLFCLTDRLRAKSERGSFVPPDNFHLTLAFLGECDEKQAANAKSATDTVSFDPFLLEVESLGRFRRPGGDIWWAGLRKSEQLLDLQYELSSSLSSYGFAIERRRFNPHITLGRRVLTDAAPWQIEPFGETTSIIDLMKSERLGGKLTYTSIHRRGKWTQPITVEPYNPRWAQEFARIRDFLLPHIKDLIVEIHHVGSTSVEGLAAKPIVDIDIEISSMGVFSKLMERLEKFGYRHQGDYGLSGREVIKRNKQDDFMKYHLYVCPSDSGQLKGHLKLRDYLRKHPASAKRYGELKQTLALRHGNDIDAYINGKTAFIESILKLGN